MECWEGWIQMLWWIVNVIQVGFDCLSDLDTNVKDGYKCHDGLWIWYMLGLIVYLIWILMLRMDTNAMIDCECDTGWNVEEDDQFYLKILPSIYLIF